MHEVVVVFKEKLKRLVVMRVGIERVPMDGSADPWKRKGFFKVFRSSFRSGHLLNWVFRSHITSPVM